jgi:hypothetical protein
MPSCPTKSFAAFRCLYASLRHKPLQRPAGNDRFRTRQTKGRSALARLKISAKTWLSAPGRQRGKPLNNANGRGGQSPRSDVAIPLRPLIHPRGLRADFSAFVLLTLVVAGHTAAAATEDAAQLFHTGRIAFENGDFSGALEAFESAVRAGLTGPAVQFNIGVAAFRLKRYERAEAAFLETARTSSMAALAHYNLGLVAAGRDDMRATRRWFALAAQEANDERLRALADDRLAALPPPPRPDWAGYASVGSGYDDNVALSSDSDVLGVSGADDGYFDVQLAMSAPLAKSWRFDAGLVFLDYQHLDQFDQFGIQGGPQYRVQSGDWTHDIAFKLAYSTLDGEGFENGRMLALQTSRDLSADWNMDLRYRFSALDGMNDFTGVGGERHEAGAHIGRRRGPWDLGVEYQMEVSDHVDESLSATRHQVVLDVRRDLNEAWSLACAIAAHTARYDVEANGDEQRTEFAIQITRVLSARWRLAVRYAHTDNDADLAELTYERNRVAAVIEALL